MAKLVELPQNSTTAESSIDFHSPSKHPDQSSHDIDSATARAGSDLAGSEEVELQLNDVDQEAGQLGALVPLSRRAAQHAEASYVRVLPEAQRPTLVQQLHQLPRDYFLLVIFGVLCCYCIGPLALWHSKRCRKAIARGDPAMAVYHSRMAMKMAIVAIVVGAVLTPLTLLAMFLEKFNQSKGF